jgi:pantetheine-phosphate adenylyltransferase
MKRIAVYPGTFDPITFGHLDIIEASAALFDEVVVGLLINSQKKPLFTVEERLTLINDSVRDCGLQNVHSVYFDGLAVDLAVEQKAVAIIRGLRLTTEYEAELNLIFNNRILNENIVPVLIPPRQEHIHISSSAVRELLKYGNLRLDKYVPFPVLEFISQKK